MRTEPSSASAISLTFWRIGLGLRAGTTPLTSPNAVSKPSRLHKALTQSAPNGLFQSTPQKEKGENIAVSVERPGIRPWITARGRSNKTMIPKTLAEHNVAWPAGGKVVDNPVDGPGIGGIGVDGGGRRAPGPVDGARAGHRPSTGYRQVFPRSVWIVRRSGRDDRDDRSD